MGATARSLVGLMAGAVLLVGCTGEIMQSRIERPAALQYFQYAATPGETRAVVIGNPFPAVSKQVVDQAVVDAMQRNHNGPMTHFTTEPGPDAHPNFRIVMAFNTPAGFHDEALCRDPNAIPSGPSGQRIQVRAGFCVADRLYSRVRVSAPVMASPDDPRFAHMIRSAMWELVPTDDPFDKEDVCTFPPC